MQLVGNACEKCGRTIDFAPDAIGCERCDKVFHRACVEGGSACPICGDDVDRRTAEYQRQEEEAMARAQERGRGLFFLASALLIALMVFNDVWRLSHPIPGNPMKITMIGPTLTTIALLYFMYFGHFFARVLLAMSLGIGALAFATWSVQHLFREPASVTVLSFVVFLVLAFCCTVLCFLPSVSAFCASRRRQQK